LILALYKVICLLTYYISEVQYHHFFRVFQDSRLTVEKFKSGFLMPTDIPFEEQESSNMNGNHSGLAGSTGESPPVSTARGRSRSAMRVESLRSTMSSGSTRSRKRAGFFGIFGKVGDQELLDPSHTCQKLGL